MIRILKQFLAKAIFVYCFIQATDKDLISYPIDLSVYDGQGSLLISWSYPDSIKVYQTKIFVQKFGSQDFVLLSTLQNDQSQYLDTDCEPNERYLYKIEIEDIFSRVHHSDIETPPFGTCTAIYDSSSYNRDISSMQDLIIMHIEKNINRYDLSIDFYPIAQLLRFELRPDHNWLELFPLDLLKKIEALIDPVHDIINDQELINDILEYEELYRNHLYLTPNIWSDKVGKELNNIRSHWNFLYKEYPKALDMFEIIAPVRIISSETIDDNSSMLKLYLFHPDQLSANEVYIMSGDEYINLDEHRLTDSNWISVPIPDHWEFVDLMMGDVFIQTCPLIINEPVIFTIQGDIVPIDSDSMNDQIKVSIDKSLLWMNEINWNPYSKKIELELAGSPNFYDQYFIKNNGEDFWEIKPKIGYDLQFIDSTFTINDDIELPSIISLMISSQGNSFYTEYIILDTIPYAISRNPDGGSWHYSESYTMGSTNEIIVDDYDQNFVPELFVLYQNYPNPFNGQTRISFDLLEDAVVSLYITDATGRIHDKLVEEEFITSGIYNYTWDGDGRSTGIYFITLQAQINQMPPAVFSRKMIYLK